MDGSAVEGGIPASAMPAVVADSTTENNCDVVFVVVVVIAPLDICGGEANIKAVVLEVVAAQQATATEDDRDNFMIVIWLIVSTA